MAELLLGLFVNAIWYGLGFASKWIFTLTKIQGQRRFWAPLLKGQGPLSVVLTDKEGASPRSPRKISLTDVHAYSDVRSILNSLGREVEIKVRSQAYIAELSKGCFISLGGPLANGVSEHVLMRLGARLPVRFDIGEKYFEFKGAKFSAAYDINQLVVRDYGLVIRLRKLDHADVTSKPVLVAFGLHGHGTQQIVNAILTDKDLARRFKPLLSEDCYALMEFKFRNHEVTSKSVVSVGKLGNNI